ncbi:hypothetical protein D3C76_1243320 [compost metagenome]
MHVGALALAEALRAHADAVAGTQADALVACPLQVDIAALHPHLSLAIEVAHGKVGVAHLCAQRPGLYLKWQQCALGYLEVGLTL